MELSASDRHISALEQEVLYKDKMSRVWVSLQHSLAQPLRNRGEKSFPQVEAVPKTAADFGHGY